ncbi:MAG: hypothetical protein PHX08_16955 [Lachnospiraceae bacterium]|nr:hypothetical protein [Lachnospiraceae bacterium]
MLNQLENNGSYLGFLEGKTALQSARIADCLDKCFNYSSVGIMTRKDAMVYFLRAGRSPKMAEETTKSGKIKKVYRLYEENVFLEITKTEYDFCLYLIENNLVSESQVNEFVEKELDAKEKEEEKIQQGIKEIAAKREKDAAEKAVFEKWLADQTKQCEENYKEESEAQRDIFISQCGEFAFPQRAYETIICIKNIDNPFCRAELKNRLHTDNKSSRKTFFHVTGLRLPNTNKETIAFLDKVQKEDYTGFVPYKERKKPEDKMQEKFYCFGTRTETDGYEFYPVMGEGFEKYGIQWFIHKQPSGLYTISSVECGARMTSGKTKAEAMAKLKDIHDKMGDEKIMEGIIEFMDKFGVSPYIKQA